MNDLFAHAGSPLPEAARKAPRPPAPAPAAACFPGSPGRPVLFAPEVQVSLIQEPERHWEIGDPPTELRFLDGDLAGRCLDKSTAPRDQEEFTDKVKALKGLLLAGRLPWAGRTIALDGDENVLDGLALVVAVHETGIPVIVIWVSGMDRKSVVVMNLHKKRSGHDLLEVGKAVAASPVLHQDPRETFERIRHRSVHAWVTLDARYAGALLATRVLHGLETRRLRSGDALGRDVREGRYVQNHHPVVLREDGCLLDGARRCHAVIETGKSIRVLVVYGIPMGTPEGVFDNTTASNLGYNLKRIGRAEGWDIQSSTRVLHRILLGDRKPTQWQLYDMFTHWPEFEGVVRRAKRQQYYLAQSVGVAVRAYISRERSAAEADRFLDAILPTTTETGTKKDSRRHQKLKAFRKKRLAELDPVMARIAKRCWAVLGDGKTSMMPADAQDEIVIFLLRMYLHSQGERVRWRSRGGLRFPSLATTR